LAKLNPEEWLDYEANLKAWHDRKSEIDTAFDDAKQEGKLEGERAKSLEIAKNLKAKGMDMTFIIETTGLS